MREREKHCTKGTSLAKLATLLVDFLLVGVPIHIFFGQMAPDSPLLLEHGMAGMEASDAFVLGTA